MKYSVELNDWVTANSQTEQCKIVGLQSMLIIFDELDTITVILIMNGFVPIPGLTS